MQLGRPDNLVSICRAVISTNPYPLPRGRDEVAELRTQILFRLNPIEHRRRIHAKSSTKRMGWAVVFGPLSDQCAWLSAVFLDPCIIVKAVGEEDEFEVL